MRVGDRSTEQDDIANASCREDIVIKAEGGCRR